MIETRRLKNVVIFVQTNHYAQLRKLWQHCLGKYVRNQIEENLYLSEKAAGVIFFADRLAQA